MKKLYLCLFLITCTFSTFSGERVYKIGTLGWVGWAPLQVAEKLGFWKKLGVNVQVVNLHEGHLLHEALFSGQADLSMNIVGNVIHYNMTRRPGTILAATDWSHGGDKIIFKKGETLKSREKKPVGVYIDGPTLSYFFNQYAQRNNMSFKEFNFVTLSPPDMVKQFNKGRLKAIVIFDPFALEAEKEGNGQVMANSADFPGVIPECLYGLNDVLATIPNKDKVNIIRGWIQAVKWTQDKKNWKAFMKILNDITFSTEEPFPEEVLREMYKSVIIHSPKEMFHINKRNGKTDLHIQSFRSFLKKENMLTKDFTKEEIFNPTWVIEALKKEGIRK